MAFPPTIGSFLIFVRNVMGIGENLLPSDSPVLQHAFDHALDEVNLSLASAPSQTTSWSPYEQAVYNLGGHLLIEFAPDRSYPLASLSWAAGVVSAITAAANQTYPGDKVSIVGVSPLDYSGGSSGVVVQATPDDTHFSYNISRNPGAATMLANAAVVEQFFANARRILKISSFAPGIVASTSDLSTSVGLENPDFMRGLTLEGLQLLKTTYGRAYLSIAQKYGPSIWGLT